MRKILNGYIHGDKTDSNFRDKIKIHKDIVTWGQLTKEDQEKDYTTVENIQTILCPAGMKVVRTKEYNVFIATFGEVNYQRAELENLIRSLNDRYDNTGISIKTVVLEDTRNTQKAEYLSKLKECKIGIFLFGNKLKKSTEGEFFTLYEKLRKTGNFQNSFIFFKDFNIENVSDDLRILKKVHKELKTVEGFNNHLYKLDDLLSKVEKELKTLIEKYLDNWNKKHPENDSCKNLKLKVFLASYGDF